MNSRHKLALGAIVGLTGLSALLFNYLLTIRLTVDEETAHSNGDKILQSGTNIAIFTAHPDDLEFLMGGTIKLLTSQGLKVTMIDVSDGEKGVNRKNLASVRRQEQKKAAKVLQVAGLEFLHLPDLNLAKEKDLKKTIQKVLQEIRPDLVFAFDCQYPLRIIKHPDHIAVGKDVFETVQELFSFGTSCVFYASRLPNALVDITTSLKDKQASVRCHQSQLRFNTNIYDHFVKLLAKYSARETMLQYTESFRLIKPH